MFVLHTSSVRVCCLFNNAVNSLGYVAWEDTTNELLIGKDVDDTGFDVTGGTKQVFAWESDGKGEEPLRSVVVAATFRS
jgi:hypothetical protein